MTSSAFKIARLAMVREQMRDVTNARVLKAMETVPRHEFVPDNAKSVAYEDCPLSIGHEQTISQPYIVAFMAAAIDPQPDEKVLEIGTGCGYSSAVLAEMGADVYTIEVVEPLGERAKKLLEKLGYDKKIHTLIADGYAGWPGDVKFDKIIVTCAPSHVPRKLIDQLKIGGKMIIPVGTFIQNLHILEKTEEGLSEKSILPVRFVPMTGEAEKHHPDSPTKDE
jgi:protein-L-isoaspartate(D-aspartate) O-methyltransferase